MPTSAPVSRTFRMVGGAVTAPQDHQQLRPMGPFRQRHDFGVDGIGEQYSTSTSAMEVGPRISDLETGP
jgi:hypothetical protein